MPAQSAKVITWANMKGGVGKTLGAVSTAASTALSGNKTLLIDADFQANSSAYLGVKKDGITQKRNLVEALVRGKLKFKDAIHETRFENLYCIPSKTSLYKFNDKQAMDTELALWMRGKVLDDFDYVIIDSRPEISKLFTNVMMATDFGVVPGFPEPDAISGLGVILEQIRKIQRNSFKTDLRFLGVVICNYDKGNRIQKNKYIPFLEEFLLERDIPILGTIPRSQAVTGSTDTRTPLPFYLPTNNRMPIKDEYHDNKV